MALIGVKDVTSCPLDLYFDWIYSMLYNAQVSLLLNINISTFLRILICHDNTFM